MIIIIIIIITIIIIMIGIIIIIIIIIMIIMIIMIIVVNYMLLSSLDAVTIMVWDIFHNRYYQQQQQRQHHQNNHVGYQSGYERQTKDLECRCWNLHWVTYLQVSFYRRWVLREEKECVYVNDNFISFRQFKIFSGKFLLPGVRVISR